MPTSSTATARPRTRPSRPPTACATASRRASRRCRSGGRSPRAAPTCSTARSRRCRPAASGSSTGAAPAELRAHLRESLPEHMVPSLFVPLAELPLNANGKVDRRALPSPEAGPAGEADTALRTPPRNPVEEVIAGIWEDLLGLGDPVGVDDDF